MDLSDQRLEGSLVEDVVDDGAHDDWVVFDQGVTRHVAYAFAVFETFAAYKVVVFAAFAVFDDHLVAALGAEAQVVEEVLCGHGSGVDHLPVSAGCFSLNCFVFLRADDGWMGRLKGLGEVVVLVAVVPEGVSSVVWIFEDPADLDWVEQLAVAGAFSFVVELVGDCFESEIKKGQVEDTARDLVPWGGRARALAGTCRHL